MKKQVQGHSTPKRFGEIGGGDGQLHGQPVGQTGPRRQVITAALREILSGNEA